jgi:hypothetical protein
MRVVYLGALLAGLWGTALSAAESTPANRDLSGYWNLPYVPNMAQGKEDAIPYTPAGKAAYLNHDSKDDPTGFCLYPGVPRIMQSPYPVQFVQTGNQLFMLFEYMRMWRAIYTDGRAHNSKADSTFMGDSVGRWEGDTLTIDTVALNDRTWLDTAGHQHSDQLHVTEHLRRTGPDSIAYDYIVDDPVMYAKPWKQERVLTPLKPTAGLPELLEYSCNENNKDLQHLISTRPGK